VLQANAEAENAIISFLKAQQQVQSLARSAEASGESVGLVSSQYREGAVDFNRVFDVQRVLTQQQDQLAVAEGSVAQYLIQLYRALGGGWQVRLSYPNMQFPVEAGQPVETAPSPEMPLPQQTPLPPSVERS
jgi:outer membrane protein TolC